MAASDDIALAPDFFVSSVLPEQAHRTLASGAADFRAKFMAERVAKAEADRRAELAQQAAERVQVEAARKAELKRTAQDEQRNPKKDPGPSWTR